MTKEEQKVRDQIMADFELAIEACADAVRSYLAGFDEIHVLQDTKRFTAKITSICEEQARKAYEIIVAYLATLSRGNHDLVEDPQYPIYETLLHNHIRIANQVVIRTAQRKAQGEDDDDIVAFLLAYMSRAFKHSSDAVLFYESTRVSVDATLFDAPKGSYFRTVCERDDKTCPICLGIEAEQARHPIPVEDKVTGINAPPFHPFCRCHVEVV